MFIFNLLTVSRKRKNAGKQRLSLIYCGACVFVCFYKYLDVKPPIGQHKILKYHFK